MIRMRSRLGTLLRLLAELIVRRIITLIRGGFGKCGEYRRPVL